MLKSYLIIVLLITLNLERVSAQDILKYEVTNKSVNKTLPELLSELESSNNHKFYYLKEWVSDLKITQDYVGMSLESLLNEIFLGTDLSFVALNNNTIIIVKDPNQALTRSNVLREANREKIQVNKVNIGKPGIVNKRSKLVLTGIVSDEKSKDPLIGVSIAVKNANESTVTDIEGKFRISLTPGDQIISFNYLNYEERLIDLSIYESGEVNIELEETPKLLDEIVVQDKAVREITTSGIGQTQISIKEIKRAPAMLGEVDLIKQIQVLPGVTTTGEAASGYNVRGGSVDQNLILYDGLPVFNSSHVFGFFSSFNAEAVRDVVFYRGGIPAEFGGRVSSVLDIRSKEGDYEKWGGGAGIGIVSSNILIHGPIKRNKASVVASFRTTYSDWLINTVKSNYINLSNSKVSFYDGTIKLTQKIGDKTKLTLSGYTSSDKFRLQGDTTFSWNNALGSLRIDHAFNPNFNGVVYIGYGIYGYDVADVDPLSGFNLSYQISYPTFKTDYYLKAGKHKIGFGLHSTYYKFNPGTLNPSSDQSDKKPVQIQNQQSLETALYLSDQIDVTERFHLDAGIRLTSFQSIGEQDVYIYRAGFPRETLNIVDTLFFDKNKVVKTYFNYEPRLGMRFDLSPQASLKLGYNRIYQYLHLVTNTTAVTPIDIWQPSGYYFKPQRADQISLGYYRNLKNKSYEMFAEVYAKELDNVLDFKDGSQLILNSQIETDLLQGKGRSYGIEAQITKLVGSLTGSFGYTYSRSFRTISGSFQDESINNGKEYASNFDQPHVINFNWRKNLSKRIFFTGMFTYRTGRPITLPVSAFSFESFTVSSFSDRNQYRMPSYHRLDMGLVIEGNHKRRKIWDGTWTFSIYNVYGRKNPYSIFFKEARPGILRPYQLAIIGTALPSLSYALKF